MVAPAAIRVRALPLLRRRWRATQPQEGDHPQVQTQADPDHEAGAAPAVDLADEVGAQEGDRVGQDADSQRHRNLHAPDLEAEVDEARYAEDVQHRHRAEDEAGQGQVVDGPADPSTGPSRIGRGQPVTGGSVHRRRPAGARRIRAGGY